MVKTSRIFSVSVANKVNKEEQCQQCFISISPEIIMLVVSVMSVTGHVRTDEVLLAGSARKL